MDLTSIDVLSYLFLNIVLDIVIYLMYYYKMLVLLLVDLRVNSALQCLSRHFCPMIEHFKKKLCQSSLLPSI
jgi:hypothetical protein